MRSSSWSDAIDLSEYHRDNCSRNCCGEMVGVDRCIRPIRGSKANQSRLTARRRRSRPLAPFRTARRCACCACENSLGRRRRGSSWVYWSRESGRTGSVARLSLGSFTSVSVKKLFGLTKLWTTRDFHSIRRRGILSKRTGRFQS